MTAVLRLALACLTLFVSGSAAADPVEPPLPRGATERFVFDPVFGEPVRLVEAGVGHPDTVVLVHGISALGACDWYPVIPMLATRFHVITFDLPGFGRSGKANRAYTPLAYATFVKWLVSREVPGPFALVGHSLGGAVALRYASLWPHDLRRLVVADAAGILDRHMLVRALQAQQTGGGFWARKVRALKRNVMSWFGYVPFDLAILWGASVERGVFLHDKASEVAALALIDTDFSAYLGDIRVPTTLLWGADDQVAPLRTARLLQARLGDARLFVIPHAGHVVMHDAPGDFAVALMAALSAPLAPTQGIPAMTPSLRVGRCDHQRGQTFTGAWARIDIVGCRGTRIEDATIESLNIDDDAQVVIERTRISGGAVGLTIIDSEVEATGVDVTGQVGAVLDHAELDFAAVDLSGARRAMEVRSVARGVFSVCRLRDPQGLRTVHGLRSFDESDARDGVVDDSPRGP